MKYIANHQSSNCRRGAMLPMIAMTLIVLIVGVVLSVDVAYMHMVRAELRTATDAAARAGAETLARTQDRDSAIDSAIRVAELNRVAGKGLELSADQIVLGSVTAGDNGKLNFAQDVEPLSSIRVIGDRGDNSAQGPVSMFFGQFLGREEFQPVQVATASSSVRDIALILDISGSMNKAEEGVTRIESLRQAVAVFIAEIQDTSPNTKISLTTYSTTAQTRPFADKTIVLMTDGNFNEGGNPKPSAQIAADRGHSIYTVTFSSGANQGIMQQVANIGGGLHLHADDGGDLAAAFQEIARALSVTLVE